MPTILISMLYSRKTILYDVHMKTKLSFKEIIEVASMLFGLFFGAGNLIFPVYMGQMAGKNIIFAVLGFLITGVGLPLLGVAALGISKSTGLFSLSSKVNKGYAYFFTCLLYLTIGPFFAIPRCATTSFSVGLEQILPQEHTKLYLFIFSLLFFIATLYFSLKPGKILTYIGKILNPCFLFFLGILLVVALLNPSTSISNVVASGNYMNQPFLTGFLEGYNTMDALASLAFGIIVVEVIEGLGINKPEDVAKSTVQSGIFSCLLMAIIYILVSIVGTQSRGVFDVQSNGGIALGQISQYYLGNIGLFILAITITLACLKTAIGLITSCAKTFSELFINGPSYTIWAILFTCISFILSNLGLNTIIQFSIPVLMFLYPLAIVLILLSLFSKFFHDNKTIYVYTIGFTFFASILELIRNLPNTFTHIQFIENILFFFDTYVPFFSMGLGWIFFTIIGLLIGSIKLKIRNNN